MCSDNLHWYVFLHCSKRIIPVSLVAFTLWYGTLMSSYMSFGHLPVCLHWKSARQDHQELQVLNAFWILKPAQDRFGSPHLKVNTTQGFPESQISINNNNEESEQCDRSSRPHLLISSAGSKPVSSPSTPVYANVACRDSHILSFCLNVRAYFICLKYILSNKWPYRK